MEAPALAAITLDPTGGGVAAVSRLLWSVLHAQWGERARLLTMFDHELRPATLFEKTQFTAALSSAQALGQADWILFSHLAPARIQNRLPARLRRPYGVFLHGIEAWQALDSGAQQALAAADLRLANSSYTANRIAAKYPGVGPIDVCPLALPPQVGSERSAIKPARLPPLGSEVVLIVGRLDRTERYKGHEQLIDAWTHVIDRVPDAQLVIVGEGNDAARLMRKANDSRAGDRVVFTGFLDQPALDALYDRAALFALPSRSEGFGLVYLEAMAHHLPCIGSVHDAAREVIVDGQTGRLVEQDDTMGLSDVIATLLLDEPLRRRMGEAGHQRLHECFSADRFRERLLGLMGARASVSLAAAV